MYKPKYFTIEELCRSAKAAEHGLSNTPSDEVRKHLMDLIEKVLDPLREWWGSAIQVSSGYRAPRVNALVGGSKTSWHLIGCAADIYVGYVGNKAAHRQLFEHIREALPFTELIWEYGGSWVHVAYHPTRLTRSVKRIG